MPRGTLKMQHEHCVYEFLQLSGTVWEKAFQILRTPLPSFHSVFSASFTCTHLELYIQVEENKSLVKMKMLEYSRNQSWKKVKGMLLYITHTHTYIYIYICNYSGGVSCLLLMSHMVQCIIATRYLHTVLGCLLLCGL